MAASNKTKITLAILLLIFASLAFSVSRSASSSEAGTSSATSYILVSPRAVMNRSIGVSQSFEVNVTALNSTNLHGFRMTIGYSAAVINCTAVQEGELLRSFGNTTIQYEVNNTSGNIILSANLTAPEAKANGNGTLAKLTFNVKNVGWTSIHLYELSVYSDSAGSTLEYETRDGFFNNQTPFDFAMPLTLCLITLASLFIDTRVEGKLKATFEEKEFRTRDVVLLVGMMVLMVSLVVALREMVAPLMILFLFSYSTLLFTFTYLFASKKWFVAVLPSIMFVLLYVFLRSTDIWTGYLMNIYAVIFAVMITIYIGSLFTWKTTAVFAALLTIADFIMVLVTGTMIEAYSTTFLKLSLPVVIEVPLLPVYMIPNGLGTHKLGLGDFFFAGLLAIQIYKRYGRRTAVLSIITMTISFFAFETALNIYVISFFPGTLMILCGWLPLVFAKRLRRPVRNQ